MGASLEYKVKNGEPEINIILDKNDYFPKEIIKGYIFLKSGNLLKKGIINYNVYNEQYYSYKDNYKKEVNKTKYNSLISKSLTYSQIIDYSLSNGINIPFQIKLPTDIYPSFEYSLMAFNGHIRNYIQIEIPEFNLKQQKFIIIKKPFNLMKSLLSFNINKDLNLFGILNKGHLSLNASYKANCHSFFDKIPIEINVDNNSNSKVEIKKIDIHLERIITFKNIDDNINYKRNDILYNNDINIDKTLDNNNRKIKINIEINIEEPESIFNKYQIDLSIFNYMYIQDKSNLIKLIPNIDTELLKCEYFIKINLIFKSLLKTENICLDMPFSLFHQDTIIDLEKNKENILNNIDIQKINENEFDKSNIRKNNNIIKQINKNKIGKTQHLNNKKNTKEPHLYTNNGNDDWNTPTNGALVPIVE